MAPEAVEHSVVAEEKELVVDSKVDATTEQKSPPARRISLADMDDINLGEGKCRDVPTILL
jgi:hypothetical protein